MPEHPLELGLRASRVPGRCSQVLAPGKCALWELCIPNGIGGVLLPSHFTSVGFPTSFNFLSICLVAALSRDGSMGSRRNQVFIFRN